MSTSATEELPPAPEPKTEVIGSKVSVRHKRAIEALALAKGTTVSALLWEKGIAELVEEAEAWMATYPGRRAVDAVSA
jgi:hypothetical protein